MYIFFKFLTLFLLVRNNNSIKRSQINTLMNVKNKMKHQTEKQKINAPSHLLTIDENEQVFSLLGRKCQSLSTAVVQLFKTESSAHSKWQKMHTAVLCFIKDSTKKSYFMRAYCLIRNELVWEHELYENIEILRTRPYLLTFEGQNGHVAFNFASESECDSYYKITECTIETRNRKRHERRNRPKSQVAPAIPPPIKINSLPNHIIEENCNTKVQLRNNPNVSSVQITPAPKFSFGNFKEKKKTGRKITTKDISTPTNFVHVSHVGWDAQKGFDLTGSENDELLQHFLNKAGVSEQQLNDRDTREFILDFVQNHNVIESFKSERVENPKASIPPPVPKRDNNQNVQNQRTAPKAPPTRQPPPPVPTTTPPTRAPPSRPPPINVFPCQNAVSSIVPPPPPPPPIAPPPPPMPSHDKLAPEKTNVSTLPVISDNRSELMESIRKGANLKKVDLSCLSTGSSGGDARNELLSEIRHGTTLRPVTNRELPSGSFNRDSGNGGGTDALADALRRALQDRGRAIHSSEDESSSSDNDGEWED